MMFSDASFLSFDLPVASHHDSIETATPLWLVRLASVECKKFVRQPRGIRAEFVEVPKTVLDLMSRNTPDQLPSAAMVERLKQAGQGTVLYAPTILTRSGTEAQVKAVQEYIYPTDLDVTTVASSNTSDRAAVAAVVAPATFETREVGVILSVLPEVSRDHVEISLTLNAEIVDQPEWRSYTATYTDTVGNQKNTSMEQPFFHTRSINTSVRIRNGTTALVAGGMSDLKNKAVTFLIITVHLVDSEGNPVAPL